MKIDTKFVFDNKFERYLKEAMVNEIILSNPSTYKLDFPRFHHLFLYYF